MMNSEAVETDRGPMYFPPLISVLDTYSEQLSNTKSPPEGESSKGRKKKKSKPPGAFAADRATPPTASRKDQEEYGSPRLKLMKMKNDEQEEDEYRIGNRFANADDSGKGRHVGNNLISASLEVNYL